MKKHVAGIGEVDMSPEEEAAWLAESEANDPANFPAPVIPLSLERIACAKLEIDGWDVTGVERSVGIAGGFVFDDLLYAFLNEEQPDIEYIVTPNGVGVTKFTDHLEIVLNGRSTVSFIVERVQ